MAGGGSKPGERRGGRPKGGLNKATADVKAIAQIYTKEAVSALALIMRTSESDAAKVAAIKELLDRGHGKATQSLDIDARVSTDVASDPEETEAGWMAKHVPG